MSLVIKIVIGWFLASFALAALWSWYRWDSDEVEDDDPWRFNPNNPAPEWRQP